MQKRRSGKNNLEVSAIGRAACGRRSTGLFHWQITRGMKSADWMEKATDEQYGA